MPKPRKKELLRCRYFSWLLGQRNGVYFADGRSNHPPLGRHSLSTRERSEALTALEELDVVKAVEHGLAERHLLSTLAQEKLSLEAGRTLYEQHVKRPRIAGGPGKTTAKRYRAVFDKFLPFASRNHIETWNEVTAKTLNSYAAWLSDQGYAYATQYLELNTLKQVIKYLVEEKHLPQPCLFKYPLRKADGTQTYCWRLAEVQAMVDHCAENPELNWLGHTLIALACTGLRISELASLRWSDINLEANMITLTDETGKATRDLRGERRTTKSGHGRSLPIHQELLPILMNLPRRADQRVFHGPLGGKLKPDTLRQILIRDVLTPLAPQFPSPVNEKGFMDGRLHSFRHYFCSKCANDGIAEQVVMAWVGHQDSDMVRRYYHLHNEESHRQMSRVQLVKSPGSRES
ncbi:tyrosine-type recombinase/integrase [Planctomicrobium sp. SH527]|uniref:tyrosine-type recombinase/integrase n=1 Tax=Planctomicrobium sp. SH527 TaxID=3448123 RepID=UPI003F5C38DA